MPKKNRLEEKIEEILEAIFNCEVCGSTIGEDSQCGSKIRADKIKEKLTKFASDITELVLVEVEKQIEPRLKFCQVQNGLSYCKNCGLDERCLEAIKAKRDRLLNL